ncbi:hypothetical protein C1646_616641 [Rhizophagus diaphanus]|nr:hypothetical protein C1646_616641 [Rhizophagus diaphanus] [Rhizophagus sp. MUCL 43196]
MAVGERSLSDLYNALKLHRRCRKDADPEVKQAAVAIIYMLTEWFPQFSDWRELVKVDEQSDVEKVMKEFTDTIKKPKMPPLQGVALPPPSLYFDRDVTRVLKMFRTSLTDGLHSTSIERLLEHYSPNILPEPPKTSILRMIFNQLKDFMVIILLIAAVVTAAEKDFKGMGVLLFVIVLNTIIGFTQEYKANKALAALEKLSVPKAQVIRDGEQIIVDSSQLVPGDIVVIEEGDAIPADLRIVECSRLEVIESILTGESLPVTKSTKKILTSTRNLPLGDCKGNAFMSTVVAKGRGKGLVVRTGNDTEIGKISAAITSAKKTITPIQRKLARLGIWLVALAVFLCALIIVIGVLYHHEVKYMINIGITLAVSVIPEGLVAVTTVTMAVGVRRMAKRSAIVRTLPSVETLGSVTVICSDKTGTLTEGKMGPSELWTADDSLYSFTEPTSLDPNMGGVLFFPHEYRQSVLRKSQTSSQSLVLSEKSPIKPQEIPKNSLNSPAHMVAALMVSCLCNNSSKEHGFTKVYEKPFDSERKLMSVVYKITTSERLKPTHLVFAKGAPEELLRKCTHRLPYVRSLNPIEPFDVILEQKDECRHEELNDDFVDLVSEQSSRMASKGLRVLGLAFKSVTSEENSPSSPNANPLFAEDNLTFVGLIGLIDPPKKAVAESIYKCKKAGIKVVMITGDHVATATAIATDIGIIEPDVPNSNRAIRGAELDLLSDEAITELDPFPSVFARVSPDNKLKIVKALQKMGNSVAMTGDGVNDAPAIKAADVGVAMGISGTEITKQAADIVLANDDFSTIVAAVEEGRQVFDNILKFIVYLLSCNGAEIVLMLVCTAIDIPLPFSTIMILWANIIADVPPAISLGVEPAEKDIMQRKPRNPKAPVLSKYATAILLVQAFTMALLPFGIYMLSINNNLGSNMTKEDSMSLAFSTLTTMQLLQGFLSRTLYESIFKTGIFGNKWMVGSVIGSFVAMLMGVYVPGINTWLELTPVPAIGWVKILICCIIQIAITEIGKAFGRKIRDSR